MPGITRLRLQDGIEPATRALDGWVESESPPGKIQENIRKHFDFVVG
jgi:hypothetical protein